MQRGFTLIELVMVILLLVILAAVAIPRFNIFGGMKQGNAALKIASDIRYAQNRATTTQKRHRINFNSSTTYDIKYCNDIYNTTTCTCPTAWVLATDPYTSGNFQISLDNDFSGVSISSPAAGSWLEFDSLGRPYVNPCSVTSAGTTVTVSYSGEADRNISIQSQTGMVSY